jgi:hypothetical protein
MPRGGRRSRGRSRGPTPAHRQARRSLRCSGRQARLASATSRHDEGSKSPTGQVQQPGQPRSGGGHANPAVSGNGCAPEDFGAGKSPAATYPHFRMCGRVRARRQDRERDRDSAITPVPDDRQQACSREAEPNRPACTLGHAAGPARRCDLWGQAQRPPTRAVPRVSLRLTSRRMSASMTRSQGALRHLLLHGLLQDR